MRNNLFFSSVLTGIFLTLTAFALATTANAAENSMKPGLWEVTTTSNLLSLASQIPPDQMENINQLAKEYGFEMPAIQNGAAISNACVTQEMANKKLMPSSFQEQAGCKVNKATQNGNSYRVEFICKNPQLDGSGVAEGTFTNAESFTGQTVFNGTVQGSPIKDQANMSGKWVSASCGNSKPLQQ
ncbi:MULTISPECIES: DUF3617 domain-containing protein [Methylotenera]|uniref:DUF3617 domain-containing protein n=1 Tax=Methylotenera TaxID=359407 RepID=UPI000375E121|nr:MULTISPECIES: DUF3617 domain-containing protein [Methylotenera]